MVNLNLLGTKPKTISKTVEKVIRQIAGNERPIIQKASKPGERLYDCGFNQFRVHTKDGNLHIQHDHNYGHGCSAYLDVIARKYTDSGKTAVTEINRRIINDNEPIYITRTKNNGKTSYKTEFYHGLDGMISAKNHITGKIKSGIKDFLSDLKNIINPKKEYDFYY